MGVAFIIDVKVDVRVVVIVELDGDIVAGVVVRIVGVGVGLVM